MTTRNQASKLMEPLDDALSELPKFPLFRTPLKMSPKEGRPEFWFPLGGLRLPPKLDDPPGRYELEPPGRYELDPPGRYELEPPGRYELEPPGRFGRYELELPGRLGR